MRDLLDTAVQERGSIATQELTHGRVDGQKAAVRGGERHSGRRGLKGTGKA